MKSIKEGELLFKYDAPFVFSEVNADVETFLKYKDGSTRKIISTTEVGQKISTKSVGSDKREDITHLYKYPEGNVYIHPIPWCASLTLLPQIAQSGRKVNTNIKPQNYLNF